MKRDIFIILLIGLYTCVGLGFVFAVIEVKYQIIDRLDWLDERVSKLENSSIIPSVNVQQVRSLYTTGGEVVIEEEPLE